MKYITQNTQARATDKIIGDENLAMGIQRANVPKEEVRPFMHRFKTQAIKQKLFTALTINSLEGIGSTRQYLEGDFQKPYAGDIDVIMELGVGESKMTQKIEQITQVCTQKGIPHMQSFGNVSMFFPVEQNIIPQDLSIQVDIMMAPKSQNHEIFRYMKDIRYFSAEPYAPIYEGLSLKGVHTSLLLEKILHSDRIHMDNKGLYRLNYIGTLTKKIQKELFSVLAEKKSSLKRRSKKMLTHEQGVQQRIDTGFPLLGETVTSDNKKLLLPKNQEIYEEIGDIIIEKHYISDPFVFLEKEYNRAGINTFHDGLETIKSLYEAGKYNEAQLQDLFFSYAERLYAKNKGVVRFPALEQMILETFPFITFEGLGE